MNSIPEKMKAVLVNDRQEMFIGEATTPQPTENEVLVDVMATALNRADILQRKGKYPPPKGASEILGLEIAGKVVKKGNKVTRWQEGDEIFGLIPGGGYAKYAVIHEDMAMEKPKNLDFEQAVAIPEVFLTAYQALIWLAELKKGETLLLHAGASGVGTAAIQIAKQVEAEVLVTASASKHETCLKLGAKHAIDYKNVDFEEKVKSLTNNEGVDVIVDFVLAPYFQKNINCLKRDGRLILLATLGGVKAENLNLAPLLTKRLTVKGSTLRSRSLDYQIRLTKDLSDFLLPKIESGKIVPVVDKTFSWHDVNEAHHYMEANQNIGKIILKVS